MSSLPIQIIKINRILEVTTKGKGTAVPLLHYILTLWSKKLNVLVTKSLKNYWKVKLCKRKPGRCPQLGPHKGKV